MTHSTLDAGLTLPSARFEDTVFWRTRVEVRKNRIAAAVRFAA
jgi:hypothetical protein